MVSGLNDLSIVARVGRKDNINRRPERKRRQDRLTETGTVSAAQWRNSAFALV